MKRFEIGDKVFGINKEAEIPREGGVVVSIVDRDYYYLCLIDGGGLGNRGGEELVAG